MAACPDWSQNARCPGRANHLPQPILLLEGSGYAMEPTSAMMPYTAACNPSPWLRPWKECDMNGTC
eukprot:6344691-Pyramimonas_sp.AAC.1